MIHAIRIGLFLAFAIPLTSAFGQGGGFGIITNDSTIMTQPPPFGVTISPQGEVKMQQGTMATKVKVDIGNYVVVDGQKTFVPLAGYGQRDGSLNPAKTLWTAAPYPGLDAMVGKKYVI